jgi:hypothetical protein
MFRPFRFKSNLQFRSEARDRQTDEERIASIDSAIETAIRAADAERTALGLRVEQARVQASFLTGTDSYEHESREPQKEAQLKDSENRLRRGEARLIELDRHIARLNHIRWAVLDDMA